MVQTLQTIRTHWKKSLLGFSCLIGAGHWSLHRLSENHAISNACLKAQTFGNEQLSNAQEKTRRIIVFLNPAAGDNKASSRFSRMAAPILHASGIDVRVVLTEEEGEAKALVTVADECDGVVAAGGDGTLGEVITGIKRSDNEHVRSLPVGVLPLGSYHNTFANRRCKVDNQKGLKDSDLVCRVISQCLSLIKGNTEELPALELHPEGQERSYFSAVGLELGRFVSAEQTKGDRLWYLGPLKHRAAYMFENEQSFDYSGVIEYTVPCSGCSSCRKLEIQKLADWRKRQSTFSFKRLFSTKQSKPPVAVDFSQISNPDCSTRHRLEFDSSQLQVSPDKDSIRISSKSFPNKWDFFQEGVNRLRNPSEKFKPSEKDIFCKELWLTLNSGYEKKWFNVDNEPFEALPIYIKFHKNAITSYI